MVLGLFLPLGLVVYEFVGASDTLTGTVAVSRTAMQRSIALAVVVSLLSMPIAAIIAYQLSRQSAPARAIAVTVCTMPIVVNVLVVILAWMVILEHDGIVSTVWRATGAPSPAPQLLFTPIASMLAMIYVVAPVMVLILLYSFKQIDDHTREAARLLDHSTLRRFLLIELLFVTPALVVSFVIGYVVTLNLYLLPEYLTGPSLTTLGLLVQLDVVKSFDVTSAAVRSTMLWVAALVPLAFAILFERWIRR